MPLTYRWWLITGFSEGNGCTYIWHSIINYHYEIEMPLWWQPLFHIRPRLLSLLVVGLVNHLLSSYCSQMDFSCYRSDWRHSFGMIILCFFCGFVYQVWMLVQRKWMYLEGIFIGGDIRSQLPEEAKKFDQIDKTFKGIMNETFKQPNIKIGK